MTRLLLLLAVCLGCYNTTFTQEKAPLSSEYKQQAIEMLNQHMNERYVFPEVAKTTEEHLLIQLEAGHFDQFTTDETFAEALTESVQSINKDKHMRIMANRRYEAAPNTPEHRIEEQLARMERSRRGNYGFSSVQLLEGNVGYLDLRGFAGLENGKEHADAAMALLDRTDAVIFDLRRNGGGSPRMVQYLCSFFFDEKVHLNSLYWREGDVTEEFWTLDEVGGVKMPDVPLFVMTSDRTFSGAEEFSYNMQTRERATLIGQTTGGGANPGGTVPINENLRVFIPVGRAINPVTKTNWEGVGVVPEIKVSADEAYDKTLGLAQEAAAAYREQKKQEFTQMFMNLNEQFGEYVSGKSEESILAHLKECTAAGLIGEGEINGLGYEHLMELEKPQIAEAIFRANTLLHPKSANVFDSYGEASMMNGKMEQALANFQRAVDLAIENGDANLEVFQRNLANVKREMDARE
ncbi:MAG: S41 family peptidase [Bacteroidota bacterium]